MSAEMTLNEATRPVDSRTAPEVAAAKKPSDMMPLNVLVVYEDALAARRATEVIARLAAQAAGEFEFHRTFWRFDLLGDRAWRDVAAGDVLAADIVILATRELAAPPPAVDQWLEDCLARRGEANTALLGLFGSCDAWGISLQDESGFRTAGQAGRRSMAGVENESFFEACA